MGRMGRMVKVSNILARGEAVETAELFAGSYTGLKAAVLMRGDGDQIANSE